MNRSVALAAAASITLVTATPAFSQGRFGDEAAQRAADRVERQVIRRAEHPEPRQPAAVEPAQATAPAPEHVPAAEPVPVTEPAPAGAQ
jgi:hypothetical protein